MATNNDPFRPPEKPVAVQCLHCGDRYSSAEIVQETRFGYPYTLAWCRNKDCDGAGFGFDILPEHPRDDVIAVPAAS